MAIDYQTFKDELDAAGEIIIFTEAGQEFEMHLDDVNFENKNAVWDNGDERYILDGSCVESIRIHSSHRMG